MAARCFWSTSCRVSARQRWWTARGEANRERCGARVRRRAVVEALAGSGRLGQGHRYLLHPGCPCAAVVDVPDGDLHRRGDCYDGALLRREGLPAVVESSDIASASRIV